MLRSCQLALAVVGSTLALLGGATAVNQPLWTEYGLVHKQTDTVGTQIITSYRMKDLTGALAAWEWLRSPDAKPCNLAVFCSADRTQTIIQDGNFVLTFEGTPPTKPFVDKLLAALPDKRDSSLPAVLTFLPAQGHVANSSRYILGPVSLAAFAPSLTEAQPGFEQGAEAQVAQYKLNAGPALNLAVFYYPTPEMARLHAVNFKSTVGANVKRSGVLVALVFGPASDTQAETLLSRVQYEAKITWNEVPPPSPIKPLYRLLKDILYISGLLSLLSLSAGLVYAGMRIYRRRYGSLDSEEAMTTLGLGRD